jgi:predicted amidohydrolase
VTITDALQETLEQASSTFDLAERLGSMCLSEEGLLAHALTDKQSREHCTHLEELVREIPEKAWVGYAKQGFAQLLDREHLSDVARLLALRHPLEALGFLRGMCASELEREWSSTRERVLLDYGTPVRFATRPINEIYSSWTPYQLTAHAAGLLPNLPYALFRFKQTDAITVAIDHGERDELDRLTWSAHERLPRIATIHPTLPDADMAIDTDTGTFFDVRPRHWDEEALLAELAAASEQEIAVLPELSLPTPGALEDALTTSPERYPPIVVAGSAHARVGEGDEELRVNESRTYLHGRLLIRSFKVHPFSLISNGRRLSEGITGGPKQIVIQSGRQTRLAVVICADLVNDVIPNLLVAAGVNLLMVPARTSSEGSFNGNACKLAASCQGVCVIVNPRLDESTKPPQAPFHVLAAVPRPACDGQSERYHDSRTRPISRAEFDPNLPLAQAVKWK